MRFAIPLAMTAWVVACAARAHEPAPRTRDTPVMTDHRVLVEAVDRVAEDRAQDEARRPAEMLAFFGVKPGHRVAELAAGGGYTAELLARAVGPAGVVYGHNTPFVLERFAAEPWRKRLDRPVMKNVVRLDRSLEDPFPPHARDLDLVVMVLFYHDT